jgi:hypothetical protein
VRDFAERYGRDADALHLSLRVYLDFDGMMDPAKSLFGSLDQMRARFPGFGMLAFPTFC